MLREIQEETSLKLPYSQLSYFGKVFVKYPNYDFVHHLYCTKLDRRQKVVINHK